MPLYEFYCADCRGKFEVLTSYESAQAGMVCATCHGTNVRKLLSVFARPVRGGDSDDYGDFSDGGDYADDGGDDYGGGGCSCGGACSCNN
jgi:putative FmdB family regulatory protein